jgi:hypothetical protein
MEDRGIERVKLSYNGTVTPRFYGIEYECLPSKGIRVQPECQGVKEFDLESGTYVISVTNLMRGIGKDQQMFAWFRDKKPTYRIGYSLFVYDVSPTDLELGSD